MKINVQILVAVIVLATVSCNRKTLFTSELRSKIESKNIDLKKLQYYIDNDVVLTREVASDTFRVAAGKLIYQDGKYFEQITLRAKTKGVCTAIYNNRLDVSFEPEDRKFLIFTVPNSFSQTGVYQLCNFDVNGNTSNLIEYDGKVYNLNLKNYLPRLLVSAKVLKKQSTDTRTMKGRTITGRSIL